MTIEDKLLSEESIDFNPLKYISILLKRRWMIIIGTCIFSTLTAVYYKLQPPVYTAFARVMPSRTQDMSSRLDTAMGGGARTDYSQNEDIAYYSQVMMSSSFRERIIKKKYYSSKFSKEVDLIAYYRIQGANEGEKIDKAAREVTKHLEVSAPRQPASYGRSTSVFSIMYSAEEPQLCAAVVNAFLDELIIYNQDFRYSKAQQNRIFIEAQLKETQDMLKKSEDLLGGFTSRNKKFSPEMEVERDRLKRSVTVQTEVFITLTKQLELAKIEEVEKRTSIEILDRAAVPFRKSKPNIRKNAITAGFLSLFAFSIFAFILDFFGKINIHDEKNREFFENLAAVKNDFLKAGRVIGLGRKGKNKNGKSGP